MGASTPGSHTLGPCPVLQVRVYRALIQPLFIPESCIACLLRLSLLGQGLAVFQQILSGIQLWFIQS